MNYIYFEQKCRYIHPIFKIHPSVTLGLPYLPRPMSQTSVTIGLVKVLCAYFWHIFGLSGTYVFGYLKYVGLNLSNIWDLSSWKSLLGLKMPFIHSLTYILLSVTLGLTTSYKFFVSSFQSLR